jgi:threonine/homoserine/homoserine lactone efflux protein
MPSIHILLLFILASLTLNLLPGPDMLYIMARTISHNKRAGLLSSAGISTGLIIHTFAAATGLSLIILQSALAFMLVKFIGAGYLIFLGIKLILAKNNVELNIKEISKLGGLKIYKQGFLTNLFNPKIIIFFMAFLPQFIQPRQEHVFCQFILFGFLFIFTGTCVNALVVLMSDKIRKYISTKNIYKVFQEKITGLILIGIGIKLATYSHK